MKSEIYIADSWWEEDKDELNDFKTPMLFKIE